MKSSLLSLAAGLVLTALAPAQTTVFHYRLNDTNAAGLPVVPSTGGLSGTAQTPFSGLLSSDIPTLGVPAGAGNRSIAGAFSTTSKGINSAATRELLNATVIANGGFTYEAWFKWDGIGAVNPIIDYAGTEKLMFQNGDLIMRFDTGTGNLVLVEDVPTGEWHYVALSFDHDGQPETGGKINGTLTWFYDSLIPYGSAPVTKDDFGDSLNRRIGVGRHPQGFTADNYAGLIYEPRVSLGALTAQQLLFEVVPDSNPQLIADTEVSEASNGTPLQITLPVRNQFGTTLPLSISGVTVTGPNAASFAASAFPSSIAADGNAGAITVDFTPSGDGIYTATLTIQSNDPLDPSFEIALEVDTRDPAIVFEPALDFGTFPAPVNLTELVNVGNEGGVTTLTLSNPVFSGPGAAAYSLVGTLPSLLPGGAGTIEIRFSPTTGGAFPAGLTFDTNDPRNPQVTIDLDGFIQDPEISVPAQFGFGILANSPGVTNQLLYIDNIGTSLDLVVSAAQISGPAAANYTLGGTLPLTITPGNFNSIPIDFDPGSAGGTFFATVTLTTNDPVRPTVTVALSALVDGALDLAGPSLLSRWTFDNPAQLGDDSGALNYDGTVFGNAASTTQSTVGSGALLLDGIGDYIEIPQGAALPYTAMDNDGDGFTIALWVNSNPALSPLPRQRYFSRFALANGFGVGQDNDNRLLATTYNLFDYYGPLDVFPQQAEWHHVAYVFNGSPTNAVSYYIDGVLIGTTTGNAGLNDTTAPSYAIGGAGGLAQEWFDGSLDDLRIYGTELNAGEIGELFALGTAGPPPQLLVTAVERVNSTRLRIEFSGAPNSPHVVKSSPDLATAIFTGEVTPAADGLTTDGSGAGFVEIDIAVPGRLFSQIQDP